MVYLSRKEKFTPSRDDADLRLSLEASRIWLLGMGPLYVACTCLVVVTPWLLGGVYPDTHVWLFVVVLGAMLLGWALCLTRSMSIRRLPVVLIPLGLSIVLGGLQMVPLSLDIHRAISPTTLRWWQELAPSTIAGSQLEERTGSTASSVVMQGQEQLTWEYALPITSHASAESWGTARYPVSLYPSSTRHEVYMLSLAVATFLLGAIVLADRVAFAVVGVLVALNGAALAFFGLAQQLTWNGQLFWSIPLTRGGVPFASYVNRNNAAGFLNMCLACAVGLTVWGVVHSSYAVWRRGVVQPDSLAADSLNSPRTDSPPSSRALLATLLLPLARLNFATAVGLTTAGCIAAGVFSSLSRGGMIGLVAASAITLVAAGLAGRWRHSWLGPVLLPVVIGALLIGHVGRSDSVIQRASTVLDNEVRQADGRWQNWADGWVAATALLPTGSGLGTYRHVYRLYERQPSNVWFYHAENQYLQTLVEAGLPGVGLLLIVLGLVALACWRLLRATDPASYALGIAGTFALAGQAVHAVFDFGLYLPANMLLLALICGAVCGRAAKLGGRVQAASGKSWHWTEGLIGLPPLRPLAASCCAALAGLLLLGAGHVHELAASQAALKLAAELDLDQQQSIDALDQAIGRLSTASGDRSEDVAVHQQLARLWVARMRAGLTEALRQDPTVQASDAATWEATDTNRLYGLVQHWTNQQRFADAASFRGTAAVPDNLPHALWHLRTARRLCPLLPDVHLMLAELTVLLHEDADNQQDLQRVRLTAPAQPAILTRCGWLELQAGRIKPACESWKKSLELDPDQFAEILRVARPSFDLARHIGRLVPDSPEWILDVAIDHFAAETDRPIRRALLSKAQYLLQDSALFDARANWLLGRIALLREDGRRAVSYFTRALTLRPDETAWRYELALALKQAGRYLEAQQQAQVCAGMEPENDRYKALLREVNQARVARKRDS